MTESETYKNIKIGADMQDDDNKEYKESNLADILRLK